MGHGLHKDETKVFKENSHMTSENFVYWLQGYLELSNAQSISPSELNMIKEHIALVLTKIDKNTEIKSRIFEPSVTFC